MSATPDAESSDSNGATLRSYQEHTKEYVEGTHSLVAGASKDWIDEALRGLRPDARILEVGSAFGRDAAYIAAKGFALECTDAVPAFVEHLKATGFAARQLNLLSDVLGGPYDLVFANAVFLHFTRSEFSGALRKTFDALTPQGRIALSLKRGQGESWSSHKLDAPRYFCFWQQDQLEPLLKDCGFSHWTITDTTMDRTHAEWLFVIAHK